MDKKSIETFLDEWCALNPTTPALVAGGYVRDSVLQKQIKDVDFFVWNLNRIVANPATHLPGMVKNWKLSKDKEDYNCSAISGVYKNERDFIYPIDVVYLTIPPSMFVERWFDWGLCKVWVDPHSEDRIPVTTTHFLHDYRNKVHTCNFDRDKMAMKVVMNHGARLWEKYPWDLSINEEPPF